MEFNTAAWRIREDYVTARITGDCGDLVARCTAWLAWSETYERTLREAYAGRRLLDSQLDVLSLQRDRVRAVLSNCRKF